MAATNNSGKTLIPDGLSSMELLEAKIQKWSGGGKLLQLEGDDGSHKEQDTHDSYDDKTNKEKEGSRPEQFPENTGESSESIRPEQTENRQMPADAVTPVDAAVNSATDIQAVDDVESVGDDMESSDIEMSRRWHFGVGRQNGVCIRRLFYLFSMRQRTGPLPAQQVTNTYYVASRQVVINWC